MYRLDELTYLGVRPVFERVTAISKVRERQSYRMRIEESEMMKKGEGSGRCTTDSQVGIVVVIGTSEFGMLFVVKQTPSYP